MRWLIAALIIVVPVVVLVFAIVVWSYQSLVGMW